MKLLFLSCHSILEYQEIKLLTELGHQVFSPHGAYENPEFPGDRKRPPLPQSLETPVREQLAAVARQGDRHNLHPELLAWADAVIVMHITEWLPNNLGKGKPVIWRTIGQSISSTEAFVKPLKEQGLKIVRYSPMERNIPGYAGEDAIIRFYEDPDELKDWNGSDPTVVNFTQSMVGRARACHFEAFCKITKDFPTKLYGPGNENSGYEGGEKTYDEQKQILRDARVYLYTGTEPASYTLNLIEAMMTGIPVVALGKGLGNTIYGQDTYEADSVIQDGISGFVSDDIEVLRGRIKDLLQDKMLAQRIGARGRDRAKELFGKEKIKAEWGQFLESIKTN